MASTGCGLSSHHWVSKQVSKQVSKRVSESESQ